MQGEAGIGGLPVPARKKQFSSYASFAFYFSGNFNGIAKRELT
jgi:hypothetical protein